MECIKRINSIFMLLMWIAKRHFFQVLQPFGLTPPQLMTLGTLARHQQPCKMSDLTSLTLHDPATMTGIIDRLAKMDLVQRFHSQTDRRVVLVEATPQGVELVKRIHQALLNHGLALYEILSDEQLLQMEHVFNCILQQVVPYLSAEGQDVDAEIEKLKTLLDDPIA
jgi:DNA-binding MarR family transcriptional regulator